MVRLPRRSTRTGTLFPSTTLFRSARAVYDAVENARVESLGSRGYQGIADNLETALALRLRSDPIVRARTRDEVPLSTALGLMVRERLTGEAPPAAVAPGMALIQDWIEEKVGADLDALGLAIDDQIAFADQIGKHTSELQSLMR